MEQNTHVSSYWVYIIIWLIAIFGMELIVEIFGGAHDMHYTVTVANGAILILLGTDIGKEIREKK